MGLIFVQQVFFCVYFFCFFKRKNSSLLSDNSINTSSQISQPKESILKTHNERQKPNVTKSARPTTGSNKDKINATNDKTKKIKTKKERSKSRELKIENLDSDTDLENTVRIDTLNEKLKLPQQASKKHTSRLDSKTQVPSKPESKQNMEFYEVYFNKNDSKQNTKLKSNIQKIKFKRRSPSVKSFENY